MITVRKSDERGGGKHGWLDTKHTFSFADYYDPEHMSFGPLRVLNEDVVEPNQGFGKHPHKNMEIITYVISGTVQHEDSMGNSEQIRAGDLQRMSAGKGVLHSEINPSPSEPLHLLQIWIIPEQTGIAPSYEQKERAELNKRNILQRVVSREPSDGEMTIHQDVDLFIGKLDSGTAVTHNIEEKRLGWLQLIEGELSVNNTKLTQGDGAAIENERELKLVASSNAHFLLFDMADVEG